MAYTVTRTKNTVHGNDRVVQLAVTADAATQTIETGLSLVYGIEVTPVSMATIGSLTFQPNSGASGVKALGYIGCSGLTTGDDFYVVAYGR